MTAKITFFPVGTGDMTLISLNDKPKTSVLIDCNIREVADNPDDDACDVASELRNRLKKDGKGRLYVDAFLLSHPDKDHCSGLEKYFHLGAISEYDDEPPDGEEKKIIIYEIWSSPMVFRRASKNNLLTKNAKAFQKEVKRRIKKFRDSNNSATSAGDRVKILGEDIDGKTDDLGSILVKVNEVFSEVNNIDSGRIEMRLLGPLLKQEDEAEEDLLLKNRSSVIIQFSIASNSEKKDACKFLTGGDAEVAVWERLWEIHSDNPDYLEYDLLQAPHHCSWHSLSYDSWSEKDEPEVNDSAKKALSQTRDGAFIMSSSDPIKDDDNDPPCYGAKQEYSSIVDNADGKFFCTGEYPSTKKNKPFEFNITREGPQPPAKKSNSKLEAAGIAIGSKSFQHG